MKISVCIATYNGDKFISEQIESILCQLSLNDEIIISDDGSTDSTISIIKEFNDKRIILIQEKPLRSPVFNIERALKRADGDIIFLSDQDDVWLPGKVAKMISKLGDVHLVFSDAIVVDKDLNIIRKSFYNNKESLTGVLKNLFFNNYIGATMAFRKEIIPIILPFPKQIPMHDQWIGLIGEYYFSSMYISEPLILYRRHDNNASFSSEKSKNSIIRKISFRVSIIYAMAARIVKIMFHNERE
jgi:glycosyltransferase involved in cell wall biosynthesis